MLYHSRRTAKIHLQNTVWILGVCAVLASLHSLYCAYIGKSVEVTESETNCWRLWATWLFTERYKHGSVLHAHFSGWKAIQQKYYLDRDVKLKSEKVATKIKETKVEKNNCTSCKKEEREVTLNSYVIKTKSSGMRNVLLLQTTNSAHCVTKSYTYKKYH